MGFQAQQVQSSIDTQGFLELAAQSHPGEERDFTLTLESPHVTGSCFAWWLITGEVRKEEAG